ncbi:hypothetical protein [Desulfonatronovibrio magnus]|uniref:hypothetical protein n=1 Tax=Desulfonatronovibrio magnus TaxID=698827 RepID=UPI0005EB945C|nr:hypothetical protein [Desulfonatronovibrio magnus]RQD67100.1 MAG: hypothetical protein D5R98_01200 [Desulfonatronovibrio sp. MSAO_Bac4]
MEKRQKIILAVMVIAILYGIYDFFLKSPGQAPQVVQEQRVERTRQLTSDVLARIDNLTLDSEEMLVLEASVGRPGTDIFYSWPYGERPEEREPEVVQEEITGPLTFGGFIEMGDKKIAIINGYEYTVGEVIPEEGLRIVSILPNEVVLESISTNRRLSIYFEDSLFGVN